jgi:hypothetical protein
MLRAATSCATRSATVSVVDPRLLTGRGFGVARRGEDERALVVRERRESARAEHPCRGRG